MDAGVVLLLECVKLSLSFSGRWRLDTGSAVAGWEVSGLGSSDGRAPSPTAADCDSVSELVPTSARARQLNRSLLCCEPAKHQAPIATPHSDTRRTSPPRPSTSLTLPPPLPLSLPVPPSPALPPPLGLCFVEFARPALRGPRTTQLHKETLSGVLHHTPHHSYLRDNPGNNSPTNGQRYNPRLSMRSSSACQR